MQLNKFTDYALRVPMYIAQPQSAAVYTLRKLPRSARIAKSFSENCAFYGKTGLADHRPLERRLHPPEPSGTHASV